jgi:broad specificity phosphatase PhoE
MYGLSAAAAMALPNDALPSLHLHRHVPLAPLFPSASSSSTASFSSFSASAEQHGLATSWTDYYRHFRARVALHASSGSGVRLKTLSLLRHAEGSHNVAEALYGTPHWDAVESRKEQYLDPELTERGQQQCASFARHLPQALQNGLAPQLVLVSPLRRTLLTAELCLSSLPSDMAPWVALEHARETLGDHTCDRRRHIDADVEAQHARVQFHLLPTRHDCLWTTVRESEPALLLRTQRLLDVIFALEEEHILVVAHSEIINLLSRIIARPLEEEEKATAAAAAASMATPAPAAAAAAIFSAVGHTLADVAALHEREQTLEAPAINSRHCQLLTFCVARLPVNHGGAHA